LEQTNGVIKLDKKTGHQGNLLTEADENQGQSKGKAAEGIPKCGMAQKPTINGLDASVHKRGKEIGNCNKMKEDAPKFTCA
jgi:hypothetical protein